MKNCLMGLLFSLALAEAAGAGATPMNAPLKEDGFTTIECDMVDKTETLKSLKYIQLCHKLKPSTKTDGYHYRLYIPKGYAANKDHKYPCMFISSPGGKAGMGSTAKRFKRDRWIVVMLVESKNGSADWLNNYLAVHDNVVKRVRIAKGLKFATGFSGGGRVASMQAMVRPGFAGVITQAAGFAWINKPFENFYEWYPPHILVGGCFGDKDGNAKEAHKMRRNLSFSRTDIMFFSGGHSSAPEAVLNSVLDRMERDLFVKPRPPARRLRGKLPKPAPIVRIDSEAYSWYLRKCQRDLDAAKAGPARFLLLKRVLEVVRRGRLNSRKEVAELSKKWQTEMGKLKQDAAVRNFETKALRIFDYAVKCEEMLAAQVARGTHSYYRGKSRLRFSGTEKQLLQRTVAAYKAVIDSKAASVLESECKLRIKALELELAGTTKKK
jgi:hypothetical protein